MGVTVEEFFMWVAVLLFGFVASGWLMKKNPYLGLAFAFGVGYFIYKASGIRLIEILQFFG